MCQTWQAAAAVTPTRASLNKTKPPQPNQAQRSTRAGARAAVAAGTPTRTSLKRTGRRSQTRLSAAGEACESGSGCGGCGAEGGTGCADAGGTLIWTYSSPGPAQAARQRQMVVGLTLLFVVRHTASVA